MKFEAVAQVFDVIEKTSSRLSITHELAALLKQATPQEAQLLSYLSLGVLNPPYKGTQFAIAQKTMVKIIARMVGACEEVIEKELDKKGDLGSVIEAYTWESLGDLNVIQLYDELCLVEKISGTGSQEKKSSELEILFKKMSPVSAKYVVRIILGTLRLGFSDMTFIDALSWMEAGDKSLRPVLEHAYNVCADSGLLAFTLKNEGVESVKSMKIHVGIPIRPAAAERLSTAKEIVEKMGPCVAEPKLDGFRLQVHLDKTGPEPLVRFFSRNLLDMSAMFPEFVEACKKLDVQDLIVDGEAIVYDPNTGTFLSFQETVKRRRKHGIEELVSEMPLQLNMFDIMYLNGESLLHKDQKTRRHLLQTLFNVQAAVGHKTQTNVTKQEDKQSSQMSLFSKVSKNDEHKEDISTLCMIEEKVITTAKELEEYLAKEIGSGLEGVVVKKPDASYQAGKRNFNWIKLKYQASEKLNDTIDVVILGYYPGRGKRAQFGIGAFLVGIYDPKKESYETLAKVGTGLTDQEWVEFKQKCDALAVHNQPKNVICSPELAPMVWVSPEIVCEVLADEITVSPLHTAGKTKDSLGLALRFPRFLQYRFDKSPTQTTSVSELQTL